MKIFTLLVLLLSSLLAPAQESASGKPAAPSALASRDQVLRFMAVAHMREQMKASLDSFSGLIRQQVSSQIANMLKVRFPDVTKQELSRFDPVIDNALGALNVDEMAELMVPIYQKHFTDPDLRAAIAFYETEAGQRVVVATRLASAEAMQVGADYGRSKMEAAMPHLKTEIEAIVADIERTHGRHAQPAQDKEFKPATPAPK